MDLNELLARFPEIPADLREEPLLERFAASLAGLLREARNPSPCATEHDRANHLYLGLIGPLTIYGYGLATREATLAGLEQLLDRHDTDPDGFALTLLPADTSDAEVRRPGCD